MLSDRLLPAPLRDLPAPWNDLTHHRSPAVSGLEPTAPNVQQAVHVLRAALPEHRHSVHGWDEDLQDAYDDRDDHTLEEADAWLTRLMPTTADVTRERVADVVAKWADLGIPTVSAPPTEEQIDTVAAEWATSVRQALAWDAFTFLERADVAGEWADEAARLAQAYVRIGLAVERAVYLLFSLGRPRGEQALLELVRDDEAGDWRPYVRSRLLTLRRPRYETQAREPAAGEAPLLPAGLRELPYSWPSAFDWGTTAPDPTALARARTTLEACLAVPPAPGGAGDGRQPTPAWDSMTEVVRALMPYTRLTTYERMAAARHECELLGFDLRGTDTTTFAALWCARIAAEAATATFRWLGAVTDTEAVLPQWTWALAERAARQGLAVEEACWFLHRVQHTPPGREALTRLATDPDLPTATRATARQWTAR